MAKKRQNSENSKSSRNTEKSCKKKTNSCKFKRKKIFLLTVLFYVVEETPKDYCESPRKVFAFLLKLILKDKKSVINEWEFLRRILTAFSFCRHNYIIMLFQFFHFFVVDSINYSSPTVSLKNISFKFAEAPRWLFIYCLAAAPQFIRTGCKFYSISLLLGISFHLMIVGNYNYLPIKVIKKREWNFRIDN